MKRFSASCKINLGLKILSRRPDGYHNLLSLLLPLAEPADQLAIEAGREPGLSVVCDSPEIDPAENILHRAYKIFAAKTAFEPALKVDLRKNIPVGSGLGGGSSDAATLLKYLAECLPTPLARGELKKIAMATGADVPFFIYNKGALLEGAGAEIQPLPFVWPTLYLVLVWPGFPVSTSWAFRAYDEQMTQARAEECPEKLLTNGQSQDTDFSHFMRKVGLEDIDLRNDLEGPVFARYPILADIKKSLYAAGAWFASMSGSGSTIYGIFGDETRAAECHKVMQRDFASVFLTRYPAGM